MITKMGKYLCTFCPDNPRATKEGYVYTHVLVAEKKLGRCLTKDECVHHLDEDKYNNTEDNIIVFKTVADHTSFHQGNEMVKDGDVYWCPNKSTRIDNNFVNLCPICNINYKTYNAEMCINCRKQLKLVNSKRPNREILKQEIYDFSHSELARRYGVVDNTIKKLLISYDLPALRHVISIIPKNEWMSEKLSEKTVESINNYFQLINRNDNDIVTFYLQQPNLTDAANRFHADIDTIKNILNKNNIRILSSTMARNLNPIEQYEDGVLINCFLNSLDAARWLISNNKSTNTVKNNSYKILKACEKECKFLNYTWKINNDIKYERFLRTT